MDTNSQMQRGGLKIRAFADKSAFYDWLLANHSTEPGLWVRYYKKASGVQTIVWEEAVEVALCFGWIDGIANKYDEDSYINRFVPRRTRSLWSKKNCQTVERLIETGLMQPAGLAEVDRAKADGRWDAAYDSPKNMKVPKDLIKDLESNPAAKAYFATCNKSQLYSIAFALQTAKKPETRERRKQLIIKKLTEGRYP